MRVSPSSTVPPLADTTALSGYLGIRLRTGDAVLTGADDPVSWIIQTGSRSPYSHVGLITGPGRLIEAYDYALTPDESDEGVFTISLDDFLARGDSLRAVEVRRPHRIDRSKLLAAAAHLEDHSPGFPTVGMVGLALCGLSGPALRRLPRSFRRRVARRQTELAGDGVRCLHCAETVTRLYHAAGLEVRFRSPRLWDHLLDLLGSRPGRGLSDLPSHRRRADPGRWPAGSMKATGFALSSTAMALRRRRHHRSGTADAADLILPGDFARAEPFTTVARFRRRGDRWIAVSPLVEQDDQPRTWSIVEPEAEDDIEDDIEAGVVAAGRGRPATGIRPASFSR